jgi:hypothetical protein
MGREGTLQHPQEKVEASWLLPAGGGELGGRAAHLRMTDDRSSRLARIASMLASKHMCCAHRGSGHCLAHGKVMWSRREAWLVGQMQLGPP